MNHADFRTYIIVRGDGVIYGPFNHRGEDAAFVFLSWLQQHERQMRVEMENKRPLVMADDSLRSKRFCGVWEQSLVFCPRGKWGESQK